MISQEFIYVASIALGLLVFATAMNRLLAYVQPHNHTFQKVGTIIKGWWVIVGYLLLCFAWPPVSLFIGFGLLSLLAAREYYKHSRLTEYKGTLFILLSAFIILQYLLLATKNWHLFQIAPILYAIFALPLFVILNANYQRLAEVVGSVIGPLLAFHFLSFAPALYLLSDHAWQTPQNSLYLLFAIIFLTEINDILQFIFGKSFGRRKIVPLISPNKTEAGFLGGLIGTTTLAALLLPHLVAMPTPVAAGLGLLISFTGILGDLFFSAVKRYFDTKDFSDKIAGHGGYLDRLDSLIFTLPVTYYYVWYTVGGFW